MVMGVRDDKTREVLGIYNNPGESATGWADVLWRIREIGVDRIGLIVADGLKGLDTALGDPFPNVPLQRCTAHLKRNLMDKVKHGDKLALAEDLRDVFRTGERTYTRESHGAGGRTSATAGAKYTGLSRPCAATCITWTTSHIWTLITASSL